MTQTRALSFPAIDAKHLVNSPTLQANIRQEAQTTGQSEHEVVSFYEKNIAKLFAHQDATVDQFVSVFGAIINIDHAKEVAMNIIQQYGSLQQDPVITEALRTLDTELNEIGPVVAQMKQLLEGNAGAFARIKHFFRNPFRSRDNIISTSLQGLQGRINSIDTAFEKYEIQLSVNQELASEQIPTLGKEIYRIEGMREVLRHVKSEVSEQGTKDFLDTVINQMTLINGIKKESLQRLIIAARMNGNSRLLLKATEFKIFGLLPSLLSLNFILSSQSKVNDISESADQFVEKLRGNAEKTLKKNMDAEIAAKEKLRRDLENTSKNIENIISYVDSHKSNLAAAQKTISEYMPMYERNIAELDKSILSMQIAESDFAVVSDALIDEISGYKTQLQADMQQSTS